MLLDDIENEMKDKEKFIYDQNEKVKNMHEVLNSLLEYKEVLEKGSQIIHGLGNRMGDQPSASVQPSQNM